MNVSFSVSYQGMKSAMQGQAESARQIASPQSADNLAREMVNQMKSEQQMAANVTAARTADRMLGSIIDLVS